MKALKETKEGKTSSIETNSPTTKASTTNTTINSESNTTCAWRIPKTNTVAVEPRPLVYPQRKIPSYFEEPKPKEELKPKSYVESFEEFPELIKSKKSTSTTTTMMMMVSNTVNSDNSISLLLDEDDDWLLGGDDNIDYSQNLFNDSKNLNSDHHYKPQPQASQVSTIESFTAESWPSKSPVSFKILKRPDPPIKSEDVKNLSKEFESNLNLNEIKKDKKNKKRNANPKKDNEKSEEVVTKKKIIYSIASKTIQTL